MMAMKKESVEELGCGGTPSTDMTFLHHSIPAGYVYGVLSDNYGDLFFSRHDQGGYTVVSYPPPELFRPSDHVGTELDEYKSTWTEVSDAHKLIQVEISIKDVNPVLRGARTEVIEGHDATHGVTDLEEWKCLQDRMAQIAPQLIGCDTIRSERMTGSDLVQTRHFTRNRTFAASGTMSAYANRAISFSEESVDGQTYIHTGDNICALAAGGLFSSAILAQASRPLERSPRLVCFACGWEFVDMTKRPLKEHSQVKGCPIMHIPQKPVRNLPTR